MKRLTLHLFCLFLGTASLFISCGGGKGEGKQTPTPTPTATPQPVVTPEQFIGNASLCTPGDTARIPFSGGTFARFTINDQLCTSPKDNRNEEYTAILYNTSEADVGFQITSPGEAVVSAKVVSKINGAVSSKQSLVNRVVQESYDSYMALKDPNSPAYPAFKSGPVYAKTSAAIGNEWEYKIRCSYDDPDIFCKSSAILRKEGTHIELWVDRDVPYADGDPDHLTLADLTSIVDVFENNIYPLEAALLGSSCSSFTDLPCPVSQVNAAHEKIAVVITPILNWLPTIASDKVHAVLPRVYVDTRNLVPFNEISNAGSNEREVIFLYAPDQEGYFNAENDISKDEYLTKNVFAWLSVGLEKLISYNFHVFLNKGSPETDWIDYGLGGVLADLAGFNIWTNAVWNWLDAPAYETIQTTNEFGCPKAMAGPYLFMLYVMESQVDKTVEDTAGSGGIDDGTSGGARLIDADLAFLSSFMSNLTGVANLENAVTVDFNSATETEFQSLFKNWTVALLTSGTRRTDLQSSSDFQYYYVRSSNLAMTTPDSRLFGAGIASWDGSEVVSTRYGANSLAPDTGNANPVGLDLNNYNLLDDSSSTTADLIENPHEFTYVPGNKFFGVVKPFTANFVRLGGLFENTTDIVITAGNNNLQGFIVRRSNITYPKVYAESIFGSLNQNSEDLDSQGPNSYWSKRLDYSKAAGSLNQIGDTLTIVGKIDESDTVSVLDNQCNSTETPVPDFDKYQITIPTTVGDEENLAIWIERQADDVTGVSTLNPMLAIVSWDDVPYPTGRYDYTAPDPMDLKIFPRADYRWLSTTTILSTGATRTAEDPVDPTFRSNGECATSPLTGDWTSPSSLPDGSSVFGYCLLDWITFGNNKLWANRGIPDVLFSRELLIPIADDPFISTDPLVPHYDPRSTNALTLDCYSADDGLPPALIPTQPDDWLQPGELKRGTSFQEQILIEMSRDALTNTEPDTLAVDIDSRDCDTCFKGTHLDSGNNVGGRSVVNMENGMLLACISNPIPGFCDGINPHISRQLHGSDDPLQTVYNQPLHPDYLYLTPGSTYVILVAGLGGTTGNYELKLRKIVPSRILRAEVEVLP